MNIISIEPLGISRDHFESLREHYAAMGHTFSYYMDRREDEPTLIERLAPADIAVVSNIKLSASVLSKCPSLKYLSIAFTGIDHIDLPYCNQQGITVQNAAGYSTTAVSELAVGMMLDLLRNIATFNELTRQGGGRGSFLGRELRGKTVGIVGTGAIGLATARLLMPFGANVIAWSRTQRQEAKALGISYLPLDDLLRLSDIVSLHLPLNNETRNLIGQRQLELMKPSALLINTARGPVCDIHSVAKALTNRRIAGAAFDVFEQEPPLPASHPLLQIKKSEFNLLLTPHIAFATEESFAARADIVFGHIDDYLARR